MLRTKLRLLDANYELFMKGLDDDVFSKLEFELVAYDEIERFNDYQHPKFDYPYAERKNQLSSFNFRSKYFTMDPINLRLDYKSYDYEYTQSQVKFQISKICLEEHYMESVKQILPMLWTTLRDLIT